MVYSPVGNEPAWPGEADGLCHRREFGYIAGLECADQAAIEPEFRSDAPRQINQSTVTTVSVLG